MYNDKESGERMILPEYIQWILSKLEENLYKAYVVGGAVRDFLLGLRPSDYDIATSATPDEIESVFQGERLLFVGKSFGTVILIKDEVKTEITTFRKEGKYDGRKPVEVIFSKELKDDLSRRDFTMNAIAYHPREGFIDYFGGKKDLEQRLLRMVGPAEIRLNEDFLRIIRGVRFSNRFGLKLDSDFLFWANKYADLIPKLSGERIAQEMKKILLGSSPKQAILLMNELGILKYVFPSVELTKGIAQEGPFHSMDVFNHTLAVLEKTPPNFVVRLSALYHDVGKVNTKFLDEHGNARFFGHEVESVKCFYKDIGRWNLSDQVMKQCEFLIQRHMTCANPYTKKHVKKLLSIGGEKGVRALFALQRADMLSTNFPHLNRLKEGKLALQEIIKEKEAYSPKMMNINGNDLKTIGFVEGKTLGKCLNYLYQYILDYPKENTKECLLKMAEIWRKGGA